LILSIREKGRANFSPEGIRVSLARNKSSQEIFMTRRGGGHVGALWRTERGGLN